MKSFKGQEISVERHEQTVLWVTNYPATYDEAKLKELLSEFGTVKEVRLPSLAFNTSRRFAYIEFTNSVQYLTPRLIIRMRLLLLLRRMDGNLRMVTFLWSNYQTRERRKSEKVQRKREMG